VQVPIEVKKKLVLHSLHSQHLVLEQTLQFPQQSAKPPFKSKHLPSSGVSGAVQSLHPEVQIGLQTPFPFSVTKL
jgi:hypothetical protein